MITDDGYTYIHRHILNPDGTQTMDDLPRHPHVSSLKEVEKPD